MEWFLEFIFLLSYVKDLKLCIDIKFLTFFTAIRIKQKNLVVMESFPVSQHWNWFVMFNWSTSNEDFPFKWILLTQEMKSLPSIDWLTWFVFILTDTVFWITLLSLCLRPLSISTVSYILLEAEPLSISCTRCITWRPLTPRRIDVSIAVWIVKRPFRTIIYRRKKFSCFSSPMPIFSNFVQYLSDFLVNVYEKNWWIEILVFYKESLNRIFFNFIRRIFSNKISL